MSTPAIFTQEHALTQRLHADTLGVKTPFDYAEESKVFTALHQDQVEESTRVDRRREARGNRNNVKLLRDKGQILPDETVIPDRTIDTNIRTQKSPYIKFIEQSQTVLSFEDPNAPGINFTPLSAWHVGLVRNAQWKKQYFLIVDSLLLHGCAFAEVLFAKDSVACSEVEYIRREDLLIPKGTRDLQNCGRMYRRIAATKAQLDDLATKYGFDTTQLDKLKAKAENSTESIYLYKGFLRDKNGVINVCWRADDNSGCDKWLKDPVPLQLGIFVKSAKGFTPKPITSFPIFAFPLALEEEECILYTQGRAALDLHVQDCMTTMWSGTANGVTRASRFYPTRKAGTLGEPPQNTELFQLKHGYVFEGDFSVFQPNWPNNISIAVANALSSRKSQEIGAVDWASMNRQDTRKTATELSMAREAADALSGPNISLFSLVMLAVETLRWEILVSRVMIDEAFVPSPEMRKYVLPAGFTSQMLSSKTLNIAMSADAQVVRRAQRQSKYIEHWEIVAPTPYALPYLETMLGEIFPDDFIRWKQQVGEADNRVKTLVDLGTRALDMLSNLPPDVVPQENQQNFVDFLNQLDAAVNPNAQKSAGSGAPA